MKSKLFGFLIFTLLATPNSLQLSLHAQGTAFTYQGRLTDNGSPATGNYDLRLRLASDVLGNNYVGVTLLTNGVPVTSGLFTVALDFGPGIFTGSNLWLQVDVRTNGGGSYTTLNPLQRLTPAPYAIMANSASNLLGTLAAGQLTGTLPASQLVGTYGNALTFSNAANSFTGSFTGNGGGLNNVNALTLGGLTSSNFWRTSGNAGTTAGTHFLGTTDNQALEMKANNARVLRFEPNTNGAPNVILGAMINSVGSGVVGAVIAGGGSTNYSASSFSNYIAGSFGSVGGGGGNIIQPNAQFSVIGGGEANSIQTNDHHTTISGGYYNSIGRSSPSSTIGGGSGNSIQANSYDSTIAGGEQNTIEAGGGESFIGGGLFNTISWSADDSVISGGSGNVVSSNAMFGTISGGSLNAALGPYAAVPGGDKNAASTNSFAAGHRAKATNRGAFVWADSTEADFASTSPNQFLIRASGGVGIGTSTPAGQMGLGDYQGGTAGSDIASYSKQLVLGGTYNTSFNTSNSVKLLISDYNNDGGSDIYPIYVEDENNGVDFFIRNQASTRTAYFAGNVGIGTTNPTSKLQVAGTVAATAFNGSFTGNGAGVTNANALTLGGLSASNFWQRSGNAGTTPGTHFLGTTDNQALELKVNGTRALRMEPNTNGAPNMIGGSPRNFVGAGVAGGTIAGGGATNYGGAAYTNSVLADFGVIGGGGQNTVAAVSDFATIAGGSSNEIGTNASYSVIGGGQNNTILSNSFHATIGGGHNNTIEPGSLLGGGASTIAGGSNNRIQSKMNSTIGGGDNNTIDTNVISATIGGGSGNRIEIGSAGATIAGGSVNDIGTNSGSSSIGGGANNTIADNSPLATIPGGRLNVATNYAFAAGHRAKANHQGAFVWGDSFNGDVASTNLDSVTMRGSGGYRLFSNTGLTAGVFLAAGGGSWTTISDRHAKENFKPVDARAMLDKVSALPLSQWNYKSQSPNVQHIGPMAQDFKAAFGIGESDTGITTIDADGVALAAIQGLNQKLEEKETKIRDLESRLQRLEQFVNENRTAAK